MRLVSNIFLAHLFTLTFAEIATGSDFGDTGLISIPTARTAADGELRVTASVSRIAGIFNTSYQLTPWAEGTFRYTIFNPLSIKSSRDDIRDRSYGVKIRLKKETIRSPQVAIGFRDMIGTGVWNGEYLVASKKIRNFDFTLGMGWGRYSERHLIENPLTIFSNHFKKRYDDTENLGGLSRGSSFFTGPIGIFGGARGEFSDLPLSWVVQFNSDAYNREIEFGTIDPDSGTAIGLEWRPINATVLGFSYQPGHNFGLRFSTRLNTKHLPGRKSLPSFYSSQSPKREERPFRSLNPKSWYDMLLYDFERSGLKLNQGLHRSGSSEASIEIENVDFAIAADAIAKALALTEIHLSEEVSHVNLHIKEHNQLAPTIRYRRISTEREAYGGRDYSTRSQSSIAILEPRLLEQPSNKTDYLYPRLAIGADFSARAQLFDPVKPLRHQFYLKLSGRFEINGAWNIWSVYGQNVYNNFSADRVSDSVLPHVRSDINLYLTKGESGLDSLFIENRESLGSSIHYRVYAGVLEEMFGGLGTEILYHQYENRWALGFSSNWVKQRGYKKKLSFRNYSTLTGFASLYYASPLYNFDFSLHAGRYLAGDLGYTFEAKRSFVNGFEIGAFFTRTNVSSEDFGEGSFDKGIYLRVPLNNFLPGNTRSAISTIVRPLDRDGGRRLQDFGQTLWNDRRSVRLDALLQNIGRARP